MAVERKGEEKQVYRETTEKTFRKATNINECIECAPCKEYLPTLGEQLPNSFREMAW